MRLALPALIVAMTASVAGPGCTREGLPLAPTDQQLRITFLHTSDWHSRLLPYDFEPPRTDEEQGLNPKHRPFGGISKLATLIKRERAKAHRVLHLDSGDCFQGAPIFNFYQGEVEIRAMSMVGVDAAVIGNHEFDAGARNFVTQLERHARYPSLAANYLFPDPEAAEGIRLAYVAQPFTILNADGLIVGVIGGANISSLQSIGEASNSTGITPLDEVREFQAWIDYLEPQVDLIVLVSHMGLGSDERVIRATTGLDLVFGGHHHIVLNPPKVIEDATLPVPRRVPLIHSGAFMKYMGKLDVVVQGGDVLSHDYTFFPIDSGTWASHCFNSSSRKEPADWCPEEMDIAERGEVVLKEDREALELVEPYIFDMNTKIDLKGVIAYSPQQVRRFGITSGDSALGNLVADAMLNRERVEADFALTNSLGIRTDFSRGPITLEQMFNVFPFENSITKVLMSGQEIVEMLDFVARRSAGRGCQSQAQVSGLRFRMNCVGQFTQSWADRIFIGPPKCLQGLETSEDDGMAFPTFDEAQQAFCHGAVKKVVGQRNCRPDTGQITSLSFDAAVNNYIAGGGSGFEVLKINTSKVQTGIALRDSVTDHMRKTRSCRQICDEDFEADRCLLIEDCIDDLAKYYARDCKGLKDSLQTVQCDACLLPANGEEAALCESLELAEASCERTVCRVHSRALAADRCDPTLPCVTAEADGRIEKVFWELKEVRDQCLSGLIEASDEALQHVPEDEACEG